MDRRRFLGIVGVGALHRFDLPELSARLRASPNAASPSGETKAYGSGYFGEWITDQFGLPAYRYTCNQIADSKALSPVHKYWRAPADHTHQVGNDRLVAAVSNYGYVQVRQDEGSPKFLNDYSAEHGHYGAGIGFLTDGNSLLSTYYPGNSDGTLIWALALESGPLAWDEWKKNSLAMHAEAYPEIWYGVCSGPDYYNSVLSRYPGQTMFSEAPSPDHKTQGELGFNWTDFPVMNMHPHAWPLYSAAKLLGLEFHERGVSFKPGLPLTEYELTSPLLGFKKSRDGYSGWYAPCYSRTLEH